jgi:hypothetical protein
MKDFGLNRLGGGKSSEYTMLVFLESRSVTDSIIRKYDIVNVYDMAGVEFSKVRKKFLDNVSIDYLDEGNFLISV